MNVELLIKLMRMTTSDNDGEALVAMRKANAMLRSARKDWSDVIKNEQKVHSSSVSNNSFRTPPSRRPPPPLGEMIQILLRRVPRRSSFYQYVKSVEEYYALHGKVSPNQHEVIQKAYLRTVEGRQP